MVSMPLVVLSLLAAAPQEPAPTGPTPPAAKPAECQGAVVAAGAAELSLWLESYRDELLVLEVTPHGSPVNDSDVVVRLDLTKIDEQIRDAETALGRQQEQVKMAAEKARIAGEGAAAELMRAQKDLEWSRRRLAGFLEREKENRREGERLNAQSEQFMLEDQQDELGQLEKMYKEDELVDATEEIVLKRSRRGLAQSRQRVDLAERMRTFQRELAQVIEEEQLRLDVEHKSQAVARQQRSTEIGEGERRLDLEAQQQGLDKARAALERLRRDRDRMVVRAPRRGLFLHGEARAVPGSVKIARGDGLPLRKTFAVVADPEQFEAVADMSEEWLDKVRSGAAMKLTFPGVPGLEVVSALRLSPLPTKRGGDGKSQYEAVVALPKPDQRLRPGMTCTLSVAPADGGQ